MSLQRIGLAVVCVATLFAMAASSAVAGQPFLANKCCTDCAPQPCHSCPLPAPINIRKPLCEVQICDTPPVCCRPTCEKRLPAVNICKPICDVQICDTPPVCCRPTCEKRLCPVNIRPGCEPVLTCNPVPRFFTIDTPPVFCNSCKK